MIDLVKLENNQLIITHEISGNTKWAKSLNVLRYGAHFSSNKQQFNAFVNIAKNVISRVTTDEIYLVEEGALTISSFASYRIDRDNNVISVGSIYFDIIDDKGTDGTYNDHHYIVRRHVSTLPDGCWNSGLDSSEQPPLLHLITNNGYTFVVGPDKNGMVPVEYIALTKYYENSQSL